MCVNTFEATLDALERGELRAATRDASGQWQAQPAVKKHILAAFRAGDMVNHHGFVDKHTVLPRTWTAQAGVRLVPGGSAVRRGAYVAPGVVVMPPSYINVGAYVGSDTMVDSHVLVGSCAQIGARVHLSAGVQIGGVLEPIGMAPVVIEDDAFIGAGAMIVEGMVVGAGAVVAPGVVLSRSVPVYDRVQRQVLQRGAPIPGNAVVVPGSRPLEDAWSRAQGLALQCPVIVKYRDRRSDAALELETCLR